MKFFGLCHANDEKSGNLKGVLPFIYGLFDEKGLRDWIKKNNKVVDGKCIENAEIGDTFSFMANQQFIFWRMHPPRVTELRMS